MTESEAMAVARSISQQFSNGMEQCDGFLIISNPRGELSPLQASILRTAMVDGLTPNQYMHQNYAENPKDSLDVKESGVV